MIANLQHCDVPFIISERVLTRWRRLVAFMKAMDLPHRAMRAVLPAHRHGHQNGQQSGHILHRHFVFCCPDGRQGDTERVVARWRCLVVFMNAMDLLRWAMSAVSHHRSAMAIEMASNGGTFVRCCGLFCLIKHS